MSTLVKKQFKSKATITFFLQTINTFSRSFSSGNIGNFKPVVIYDNADVDKMRILTENRKKVAVYLIFFFCLWSVVSFSKRKKNKSK
jgi:hypothetical protein